MKPANISKQRIMGQLRKLQQQKLPYLYAAPLEDDLYTWHFTFQGPENTEFHEGIYHGQILLPYEYPFKPPDIVFMNKNGRFETNTKICLTITQYHPEEWNSAWTIRTMLEAVISLFAENVQGVGALTSTPDVRTFLARSSHSYVCEKCGPIEGLLPPRPPISQSKVVQRTAKSKTPEKEERPSSKLKSKLVEVDRSDVNISQPSSRVSRFAEKSLLQSKKLPSKLKRTQSIIYGKSGKMANEQIEQKPESNLQTSMIQSKLKESRVKEQKIVYIKDRLPISSELTSLTQTVKTIQSNLKKLEYVSASMQWVD